MRGELHVDMAALHGFLLVLGRVGGIFTFVPIPGFKAAPSFPKILLCLALAVALLPFWPVVEPAKTIGELVVSLASEAALGILIGVVVAFMAEALMVAMQAAGLQAGYSYASTIDPSSEADTTVLQTIGGLAANLLFFAAGLDRQVVRAVVASLESYPPGTYLPKLATARAVFDFGAHVFVIGLRLALPVVALLLLVDVALALMGRVHAQLQLLSLAFPAKMLVALALLTVIFPVVPILYREMAAQAFTVLHSVMGR